MSWLSAWLQRRGLRKKWIRGRDRRHPFRRVLDRRRGEPGIVHVFGDSHSGALAGLPDAVIHTLPGTTMFRVGRDRAWFLTRTQRRRGRNSALLLAFGEIDVRFHVARVAAETGQPVSAVIETLVAAYLDAVAAADGERPVAICAVPPPATNEMAASADLPAFGTVEERVRLTQVINDTLRRASADRGHVFCNPYAHYADERGSLRPELSDGNVHIDRQAAGPLIAALQPMLVPLRARAAAAGRDGAGEAPMTPLQHRGSGAG